MNQNLRALNLHIKTIGELDREVQTTVKMINPDFDFRPYSLIFEDVVRLFSGQYPGYKASNTSYHNLDHTLSTTLAAARLLHGCHVGKQALSDRLVFIGLASALLHDIGYIQTISDIKGSGAKYTLTHVQRSIDLLRDLFAGHGFDDREASDCGCVIRATDLDIEPVDIAFSGPEVRTIGAIVATADIIAQLADELYLEKLPNLYKEFEEGGVTGFSSEFDLAKKTARFKRYMDFRLKYYLEDAISYMKYHFRERHGMDHDPYLEYISKNMSYLSKIIKTHGENYKCMLRRDAQIARYVRGASDRQ
ncbi:MAG: HD domain-containing protein [Desulfovibrionaceae bacterium]|nr:HD domain-containing protein [Desulfovibrionaceae bacterium]